MTPLGHAAASVIINNKFTARNSFLFVCLGVIPDIDFIFVFFDFFNSIHRIVTHNIFFVITSTIILYLIFRPNEKIWKYFLPGLVHLFIDSIFDANASNGIGVAFLYPISEQTYSPFNLTPPISNYDWNDISNFIITNYKIMIYEIPLIIYSIYLIKRKKSLIE